LSKNPALVEGELKQRIRDLGERLDAHRKRQQEQYPDLTLTGIYNVLEKLRAGEALTAKDRDIHDKGLVSVLKQIHDDLDEAVLEAYGWDKEAPHSCGAGECEALDTREALPKDSPFTSRQECRDSLPPADTLARGGPAAEALEQQILTHLVALNHERAAEEKRGLIRYLRPDYQRGGDHRSPSPPEASIQGDLAGTEISSLETENLKLATQDWPTDLPAQVAILRKLLPTIGPDPESLAACFGRKNKKRSAQITGILATLKALGHI
jgi:hypothetical protein